jgi:hypothetical protein
VMSSWLLSSLRGYPIQKGAKSRNECKARTKESAGTGDCEFVQRGILGMAMSLLMLQKSFRPHMHLTFRGRAGL